MRHAALDMLKRDKQRMFYSGLLAIFTGQVQLWFFVQIARFFESINSPVTPYLCLASFLGGCAMAHPWYLVGMRIQYNRFSPAGVSRDAYQNTLKALLYIRETHGLKGFYRGFFPALFVYSATYYEELHRMVFSKVARQIKGTYIGIKERFFKR